MKSWDEIRPDPLTFPIGGKVYTIPDMPYDAMLTMQRARAGEDTYLKDAPVDESWRLVMGHAWDEMVADNVPAEAISRAGLATLAYFELGPDAAEAIWEHGVDPKAIEAAMNKRASPPEQNSTASENPTPSPVSMRTTSSRKGSSKKPKAVKGSPS